MYIYLYIHCSLNEKNVDTKANHHEKYLMSYYTMKTYFSMITYLLETYDTN